MKKAILLGTIAVMTISSTSHAWRIEVGGWEAKGDDPKPVVDVVEGVKHGGTQVANAGRDIIAAVGNATGITDILESNKQTFVDIGRTYTCFATLCYSEHLRKQEIEKAEAEAKALCDREIKKTKAQMAKMKVQERKNALMHVWDLNYNRYNLHEQHINILSEKQRSLKAVHMAASKEFKYRQALLKAGAKDTPKPAVREMIAPTIEFQKTVETNYEQALTQLNDDIVRLEKSTGRTRAALMTEFIRLMNWKQLTRLLKYLEAQSDINMKELSRLRAEKDKAYADYLWAKNNYEAEFN